MAKTAAEKILSRSLGRDVSVGEIVYPIADLVTMHDLYTVPCDRVLQQHGITQVGIADKLILTTDHEPLAVSSAAAERHKKIREIAGRWGVKAHFDSGRGGQGHVFPMEMGMVLPGDMIMGYDLHVPNFGAVGALGLFAGMEAAELLACGSIWQSVPETVRVDLVGDLPDGITARDVAQKIIAVLGPEVLNDAIVEFGGPALKCFGFEGRMTLCNTPLESTARTAFVEPDQFIQDWCRARSDRAFTPVFSDADATYRHRAEFDISLAEPQIAAPPRMDNVVGVSTVLGEPIHHAFVGSCANGGLADLRDTARILRGRKVHERVRMVITPATYNVLEQATAEGLIEVFSQAGVMLTPPGCGPCAIGLLFPMAEGENSINTGTVNEPGRLRATEGNIYLASPMSVAAAAISGEIVDPRAFL